MSITNSRVEHIGAYYSSAAIYVVGAGPVTVTRTRWWRIGICGDPGVVSELIGGSVNVSRNTVDGAAGFGIDVQASSQAGSPIEPVVRDNSVSNVAGTAMVFRGLAGGAGEHHGQHRYVEQGQCPATVGHGGVGLAVPLPGGGLPLMVGGALTQSAGTTMTVAPGTALKFAGGGWMLRGRWWPTAPGRARSRSRHGSMIPGVGTPTVMGC